jgi:hypothetical protein
MQNVVYNGDRAAHDDDEYPLRHRKNLQLLPRKNNWGRTSIADLDLIPSLRDKDGCKEDTEYGAKLVHQLLGSHNGSSDRLLMVSRNF